MSVTTERIEDTLVVTLDDGAKNVLDVPVFGELTAALDGAPEDVTAIVLTGRDDILSAGLNLKVLQSGAEAAVDLIEGLGRFILRLWTEPRPVVVAAHGHAIAGGTMLCMAADHSVVADGPWKLGLTEVAVGLPLPRFGVAIARHNLRNDVIEDLVIQGRTVSPAEAVEVGFATELAAHDDVTDRAMEVASALSGLPRAAFAETKRRFRQATADEELANLHEDASWLIGSALG
ncbi:MAG: crotonase/enoyl-CoA hydratase family protein [Nitriliruptorales bacterium]|nr:crotonase/enoyl-CoA hydratase family protein [Nitriliruptorales bacterium]